MTLSINHLVAQVRITVIIILIIKINPEQDIEDVFSP